MTDRARFVNQIHRRPFDRCFNMEFGYWQENYDQWPLFTENGVRDEAAANAFFSFDRIGTVWGQTWLSPGFTEEVVSETATMRTVRNSNGLLAEIPKDGHSTIPHFIGSSIRTPDDWKRCKAERLRPDDPARVLNVDRIKAWHPADRDYPLAVDCGSMIGKIRDLLTIEGLAYAVCDYPDMVEDMVETACQLVEHALAQLLPHIDFDLATGWEDISCNSGPLISMDFFVNAIIPRYKRIGRALRAAGIDIWWTDCDGDIRAFLPHWLDAGLNTMFPFEVNGNGQPGRLLDQYGDALHIVGGVDKMALRAGRAAIREYLEGLVPYVARGGFIPHVDHRCPPDVKPDDYLYYLDLKEELFGMK